MLKRTLSAMLALVMLICAFPMAARAEQSAMAKIETIGIPAADTRINYDPITMYESEKNNSRSTADYISYDWTDVYGWVGGYGDSYDYFKITTSKSYFFELNAISGAEATNTTKIRLMDKDGDVLKTAKYEGSLYSGGQYDDAFSMTYYLSPGTYYLRLSENSDYEVQYWFRFGLFPHLATPQVKGSNKAETGKPVLKWDSIANAANYRIYRATSKSGDYDYLASTSKTSYTDKTAKPGRTYYYKVKAMSGVEEKVDGKLSSAVKVVCDCARPDVWLTHRSTTGKNIVKWDEVAGAEKYRVYVSTSKTGTYKLLGTTSKLQLVHSEGGSRKMYYYKVKAISSRTSAADSAYSLVVGQRTK